MKSELETAKRAARAGGAILKRYFGNITKVTIKGQRDYVTNADLESEHAIKLILKEDFPGYDILAEESGIENRGSSKRWIIDPLDGTNNFVFGLPMFAVSIALAQGDDVIVGVVYDPTHDILYCAEKGKGAFRDGKRIHVTDRPLESSLIMHTSYLVTDTDRKLENLKRLVHKAHQMRFTGAATIDCVTVAEGTADGYIDYDLKAWDFAAGALLIEEAGGKVTDFKGGPWTLDNGELIGSNGVSHAEILRLIR